MAHYAREEILSSSEVVRNFGAVLNSVVQHQREKVAIIRNNRLEAVLVAADVYERLETMGKMSATGKALSDSSSDLCNSTALLDFLNANRNAASVRLSQEQIDLQVQEEREAWD
jgi:hypothetical protein